MTPPKKPEWIHIADTDNAASVRKVSKTLPVIALGSALMIIGAGVGFAQSNNEAPALAVESIVASTQPITKITAQTSNTVTSATSPIRAQSVTAKNEVTPLTAKATVVTPKAPGLQIPTKSGDDEGGDD
jgi:hypothetical protein